MRAQKHWMGIYHEEEDLNLVVIAAPNFLQAARTFKEHAPDGAELASLIDAEDFDRLGGLIGQPGVTSGSD